MRTRNKYDPRKPLAPTLSKVRAALSNGSALSLADIDERGRWCRRLRDLIGDQVSDLGGAEVISSAEMVLVRRAAMITLQLEMMDAEFARNDGVASAKALDLYGRTAGNLRRLLEALGLQRRQKDVTTLGSVLRQDLKRPQTSEAAE
jgi:hypothetical protein